MRTWDREGIVSMSLQCVKRCPGGLPLLLAGMLLFSAGVAAQSAPIADQLAACKEETAPAPQRIEACTRLIAEVTDDEIRAEALIQRGVLYELSDDREAAIKDYDEAIRLDGTNPVPFFNRGNVRDQMGEYDLAIADYTQAIKIDPTDPDIFNNRGQVYDSKGEYDLAIADYSESIRLNPDNQRAFFNRALAHIGKGEHQHAVTNFNDPPRAQRCGGLCRPRRRARGARQQGRRAGRLHQGAVPDADPRGGQGRARPRQQLSPAPQCINGHEKG
jgi:tetratricopeptide (TPR) repeat protein